LALCVIWFQRSVALGGKTRSAMSYSLPLRPLKKAEMTCLANEHLEAEQFESENRLMLLPLVFEEILVRHVLMTDQAGVLRRTR
jgi:hypothetical protein